MKWLTTVSNWLAEIEDIAFCILLGAALLLAVAAWNKPQPKERDEQGVSNAH